MKLLQRCRIHLKNEFHEFQSLAYLHMNAFPCKVCLGGGEDSGGGEANEYGYAYEYEYQEEDISALLEEDRTPPSMTLRGDGQPAITPSGTFVMVDNVIVGTKWTDPGVEAYDEVEGNLTRGGHNFAQMDWDDIKTFMRHVQPLDDARYAPIGKNKQRTTGFEVENYGCM